MREKCIEGNAETLTTAGNAESIKGDDEESWRVSFQPAGQHGEH
jgi:hypothetical protein